MGRSDLLFEGVVEHHGTFAFLLSDDPARPDLFLKGPTLRLAMDGDRAVARLVSTSGERSVGEILRVTKRARSTITGILRKRGIEWFAFPEEGDERDGVKVLGWPRTGAPAPGDVVVVRLTQFPTFKAPAGGLVEEILGRPRAPGVRLSAVLRSRGIFEEFPPEVLAEAAALPGIRPEDIEGRLDLRSSLTVTIDGADAKDFDDAVSLEVTETGLRLGVHIADVSHYVRPGTALDREAIARGTSVYVADRVVPMLPPRLSEDLCSLRPSEDKLTISCFLDIDDNGVVRGHEIMPSIIRSRHRLIYEDVEDMNVPADAQDTLGRMSALAQKLTQRRFKRGGLDIDMPEYKVVVDPEGRPLEVTRRKRLGSHRLIEEFMLLANEAVARELETRQLPFLRRVHEDPDPKRLETLAEELRRMGAFAPAELARRPDVGLQETLERNRGHALEDIINMVCVRSLKQARYSERPGGHFGLASKEYCHFTSPIRRYPDLQVHRALRGYRTAEMKELAESCSERERAAVDAERKSIDILRAELLRDKIGTLFDAVVTGHSRTGVFVTFAHNGASGLARDAKAPLGARVRVRLEAVDEGKGELDVKVLPRGEAPGAPAERRPGQDRPPGERRPWKDKAPGERRPWQDKPSGERRPWKDKAPGERRPWKDKAPGERRPWKDKPAGERRPWKDKAPGERRPWQDKPSGGEQRPWKDKAPGERRPWKDKPAGERRPWKDKAPGERRPWQDKPPGGEQRPWKDKASGGEQRPWRDKAPGERRPWKDKPAGERRPWQDKPPGERRPWKDKAPGERRPWQDKPAGERRPWQDKPSGERKPWKGKPGDKPWNKDKRRPGDRKSGPRKPFRRPPPPA